MNEIAPTGKGVNRIGNHSTEYQAMTRQDANEVKNSTLPFSQTTPDGVALTAGNSSDVTWLRPTDKTPLAGGGMHNDTGQSPHFRGGGVKPSGVVILPTWFNKTRDTTHALGNNTYTCCNTSKALLIPSTAQYMAGTNASRNGTTYTNGLNVSPVDVIIVTSILMAWFIVIGLFIHKWQHLRLVEPREYRFQHKPKNLDSVKIVKRQSDSVIYRSYPDAMTKTMAARKKRLERMHTMPAIKVDLTEKSPAAKVRQELAGHIPILCLHSMVDLEDVSDEEATERDNMLRVIHV